MRTRNLRPLHLTALALTIVGALNWGLWAFFHVDIVATVFGGRWATAARVVYALIGVAGLVLASTSYLLERRKAIPVPLRRAA